MSDSAHHDTGIVCLGAFGAWCVWCPCGLRLHGLERDAAIAAVAVHLRDLGELGREKEFLAHWRTVDEAYNRQKAATRRIE
jgi:hypothetical protein